MMSRDYLWAYDHGMMPPNTILILYMLAVVRLTTLVTHDQITRPVREWAIGRFDATRRIHRLLVYLLGEPDGYAIGCPWCVSIWVGAVTAPMMWAWSNQPWMIIILLALAVSQTSGMIYTFGRHQ